MVTMPCAICGWEYVLTPEAQPCPKCGGMYYLEVSSVPLLEAVPVKRYVLSERDRLFLRSLKIAPEV